MSSRNSRARRLCAPRMVLSPLILQKAIPPLFPHRNHTRQIRVIRHSHARRTTIFQVVIVRNARVHAVLESVLRQPPEVLDLAAAVVRGAAARPVREAELCEVSAVVCGVGAGGGEVAAVGCDADGARGYGRAGRGSWWFRGVGGLAWSFGVCVCRGLRSVCRRRRRR